jgi:hypothetical protein
MDNVVIERPRTGAKYEDVCLKAYAPIARQRRS